MKRTILYRIALFAALITTTFASLAEATAKLGVTASPWSPYVARDLPDNGLAVRIVMTALQRAGYAPSFSLLQWPKDLEETVLGNQDVIASVWYTAERERDLLFSEPMIENRIKLMARADSDIRVTDIDALKGKRIGVVEDYAYTQGAYTDLRVDLVRSGSVEENLQQLLDGEIDVAVVDETVALYALNNKFPGGIKKIRIAEQPVSTRGLRIAVSRKRPDAEQIVSAFETALQKMKDDGTYLDILHQYRVSP